MAATSTPSSTISSSSLLSIPSAPISFSKGYGLEKLLSGPKHVPVKFLSDKDCVEGHLNHVFKAWMKQDQHLLYWLFSSLSNIMLALVVGCTIRNPMKFSGVSMHISVIR